VASPRLTPEADDEQVLKAFPEFLIWPDTLARAKFAVRVGATEVGLLPLGTPDSVLWKQLFTDETPVAGFQFKDMSEVNLRSFPVRNVLGFVKRHYGRLAVQSASNHPSLLPWRRAHGDLKAMLQGLGTRTRKINLGRQSVEVMEPGFDRFYDEGFDRRLDATVFGRDGVYGQRMPSPFIKSEGRDEQGRWVRRVLPADWQGSGGADAAVMTQFVNADEYSFYQADRFYRRQRPTAAERAMRRPDYTTVPPAPTAPEYDFHRIVASFGDFPELLRRLGLVTDFALDDDGPLDALIGAGGGVAQDYAQLRLDWEGEHQAKDTTPFTAFHADKERFVPRARGQDQARGLLKLEWADDSYGKERSLFDLYQVDPDGAALKTVNFALTAQRLVGKHLTYKQSHGEVTYTTGDRQGVAALRSGGLGVSRHGRAEQVADGAAMARALNSAVEAGEGNAVVLFAEDVQRGFRVDVAPVKDEVEPGRWYTLCARVGEYQVFASGEAIDLPADEGHVSGASTATGGDNPDDHYLHESLFRWTGWSLCSPRPGLSLKAETPAGSELQAEVPSQPGEMAERGNGVRAAFKAQKGTLPRLRFGQLYRFRARMVDLAGNSLALDEPTLGPLEQASEAVGYWRFEPVDPPTVVHRARVSEGESLERMVIRSNHDCGTAEYPATEPFATAITAPASQDFEYPPVNERHVVPPKSSQQQCETHGLFDPYFGDWEKIKEGYAIAAREAGTLYESSDPASQIELVTPASVQQVATTASLPPALPDESSPVGDRLVGGQFVIHREARLITPWLPDGASGGVAIRAAPGHALPGVTEEKVLGESCVIRLTPGQQPVILVRHGGDWPDSAGFRLILAERPQSISPLPCEESFPDEGEPEWDEAERTLTLFVAKGRIVRLVYSSFVDPRFIGTFGVPRWAAQNERAGVELSAVLGANWLLAPFRELTLVHVTQTPVCLPMFETLTPQRALGSHEARLITRGIRLHGPSTGKFEIEADWAEWVDDLAKPVPERITVRAQLPEVRLAENHPDHFDLTSAVEAQLPPGNHYSDTPTPSDRERARGDVHVLGDTRFRLIRYRMRATTRFREYLPPAIYANVDAVTRLGPVAQGQPMALPAEDDPGAPVLPADGGSAEQTRVPASAPPKDPRLLYVVPTFRWHRPEGRPGHDVTRYGNGLRVWLDRPWFSSGDGELLGVVIFGDGKRFTDIDEAFQPLVTQWGTDPFWDSAPPKNQTKAADFTARVAEEWLRLQERPAEADPFVQVIGHRVHWDGGRRLWYCDIELDPGASYMPFVRLALVRYQPNALPTAKISKVVLAEFAQVLPRRRAVATMDGGNVKVALHGPNPKFGPMKFPVDSEYQNVSFLHGPHETGRNRVELVLQTRDPGVDSDLAWEDTAILKSAVIGEQSGGGGLFDPRLTVERVDRERRVETRAGTSLDFEATLERLPLDLQIWPGILLDPPFWEDTVAVPASSGDRPRRLMVREFERFYSDHVLPQRVGSVNAARRVIEERLVYADVITL
jgi:hypothetical protein